MSQPPTITALGEVLWDVFPDGPRFGGAPANQACHAAALGADAWMVSRVGNDPLGHCALDTLRQQGVNVSCVGRDAQHPTGTVQVALDAAGKPSFTIGENVAWDHLEWSEQTEQLAARCDAVCFGTLGQRGDDSRQVIRRFVAAVPKTALRILDVNLRAPFYDAQIIHQSLELANVFKLSDDELNTVAAACGISGTEAEMLSALIRRYELQAIALSRGGRGATLVREKDRSDCEGFPVDVKDTVGAGDAFTATLAVGLLAGRPLDAINRRACEIAAYVCSQSGATPPLPDHLRGDNWGA
jgi:fructokinase